MGGHSIGPLARQIVRCRERGTLYTARVSTEISLGRCLVTGGSGYFGRTLVAELLELGQEVRVLDIVKAPSLDERAEFIEGDLRSFESVRSACDGVDTVFHSASVIDTLTLAPKKSVEFITSVNVGGTENVIRACRELGIGRLVYTSSVNAVVQGVVAGGDESIPYPVGKMDLYTATKCTAERLVLEANDETLATCAFRPGTIYGPTETQHFTRLVSELKSGRLIALVGSYDAQADNTFVLNLTSAHIEAAKVLAPASKVSGQPYFINDGQPMNYWRFFQPLIEGLGYTMPRFFVPRALMMFLAFASELVHFIGGPRPFMTRMEVMKVCDDQWFRIEKAKADFGWEPRLNTTEGIQLCLPQVKRLHDAA